MATSTKPTIALHRVLKGDRIAYVAQTTNGLVIGTSHLFVTADNSRDAAKTARELLGKYNLPLEPAVLEVNGTITRDVNREVPRIDQVTPTDNLVPLERTTILGRPVTITGELNIDLAVFEFPHGETAPVEYVCIQRQYLELVENVCGPVAKAATWKGSTPLKPLRLDGPDGLLAVVMPTRAGK